MLAREVCAGGHAVVIVSGRGAVIAMTRMDVVCDMKKGAGRQMSR